MPRFVIVTVNDYHESEPVSWTDGSRHVFYQGDEFEASYDEAHDILHRLKQLGRTTVRLISDSVKIPGFDFSCARINTRFERALDDLLGRVANTNNASCYITKPTGAEFHAGDQFMIGELILAEIMQDGTLIEHERVKLRNPAGEDTHVIDEIIQSDKASRARIKQ